MMYDIGPPNKAPTVAVNRLRTSLIDRTILKKRMYYFVLQYMFFFYKIEKKNINRNTCTFSANLLKFV